MSNPASRQDGEEDDLSLEPHQVSWQELDNEEPKVYVGCATNFYYLAAGRFIRQRPLYAFACLDQEQLIWSNNSPKCHSTTHLSPPYHGKERLPENKKASLSGLSGPSVFETLPGVNFTRILELLPELDGRIECRLHIANVFDHHVRYQALSYTSIGDAGPPPKSDPKSLVCNGKNIMCKENLVQALERLRSPNKSRFLWVADLCINMNSIVERNDHAKLSGSIFRNADQVIVWLGPDTEYSGLAERAFTTVCKVVNTWRARSQLADRIPKAEFAARPQPPALVLQFPRAGGFAATEHHWFPAIGLFRCAWFSRTWSVAEIALAKSVVVLWGDCQISWDWIGLAAGIMRENYGRLGQDWRSDWSRVERPVVDRGILQAYLMYRISLSQRYFEPQKVTFHQLLSLTRGYECQVEHDKVYALLNVPTLDSLSSSIRPDYAKAAALVNGEVSAVVIRSSQSLDLLSSIQQEHDARWHKRGSERTIPQKVLLDGPSWSCRWGFNPFEVILPLQRRAEFSAATALPSRLQVSHDKTKLSVAGVIIDAVRRVGDNAMHCTFRRGFHSKNALFQSLPKIKPPSFADSLSADCITKDDLEHLALTLTCGKDWDGFPVADVQQHIADYARCLLRDGLRFSLRWLVESKSRRRARPSAEKDPEARISLEALEQLSVGGQGDRFLDAAATPGRERCIFMTERGFWGVGPDAMGGGDLLCVLHGAAVPFIIRPYGDCYLLIGECYVHEIMRGEVVEMLRSGETGGLHETLIQLV